MSIQIINPVALGEPSGYSNGVLAQPVGALLFIAGQIGWNKDHEIVSDDLVEQFDKALENLVYVVKAAGGEARHLVRLAIYVTDQDEYLNRKDEIGEAYRKHMDKHFPTMILVQVAALVEEGAQVEIEGTAVI